MPPPVPSLQVDEVADFRTIWRAAGFSDLFMPLDDLLVRGGDPRLSLDLGRGVNEYGCGPFPSPDVWCFASSTASPISQAAYARVGLAREKLMRSAIAVGFEAAFDARTEEMREELKACLELAPAEIVFSPSGTDSQLHALALARSFLGPRLTTIVVAADQTGSGTAFTARGHHFSSRTASERAVRKDAPIAGLAGKSIVLPLLKASSDIEARADGDNVVLDAVETTVASGSAALLQIMDSSKLGWRAPSEACLNEIARRWPDRVQIVVDACQMRLSRRRLDAYLERGYMVLITGSKFFGGPAFSGALLIPVALRRSMERGEGIAAGLADYASRSDWPKNLAAWRTRFEARPNIGQWLRWEAALAEMEAYYRLPGAFRKLALREFGATIANLMPLSPSLQLVAPAAKTSDVEDEEFAHTTIFPFTVRRNGDALSATDCRLLHRALTRDCGGFLAGSPADRALASQRCLVGQPVRIERQGEPSSAVLRLCVGARLVTDAWSPDRDMARQNLLRESDRIAGIIAKIELLLARSDWSEFTELAYGN
jgi:selenocysteine lyase/cysteine desulfurase